MILQARLRGQTVDYTVPEAARVLGVTEEWLRRRCCPADALPDGRSENELDKVRHRQMRSPA